MFHGKDISNLNFTNYEDMIINNPNRPDRWVYTAA